MCGRCGSDTIKIRFVYEKIEAIERLKIERRWSSLFSLKLKLRKSIRLNKVIANILTNSNNQLFFPSVHNVDTAYSALTSNKTNFVVRVYV